MKKSTLITTIAMIVVVVVALSTATYAWFSSQTTSSVSGEIKTTAASEWIIMGAGRSTSGTTDTVTYSSSQAINLVLMNGLYSPTAAIAGVPSEDANSITFGLSKFYNATQDGTGLVSSAKASLATVDPIDETVGGGTQITSGANYVRVINTKNDQAGQTLRLTITVVTDGTTDSDFIAANGFCTYVAWNRGTQASDAEHANTKYYWGGVSEDTSSNGSDTYYVATRNGTAVSASGVTLAPANNTDAAHAVDLHNELRRADPSVGYVQATSGAPLTIGEETIEDGWYYQLYIDIADADHTIATNGSVSIAFYAWFDGWVIDNTGANSNAKVYYEFGKIPTTPANGD